MQKKAYLLQHCCTCTTVSWTLRKKQAKDLDDLGAPFRMFRKNTEKIVGMKRPAVQSVCTANSRLGL